MKNLLWEFINEKSKALGMTQGQLEDASGVSHMVLTAIKNGRTNIKAATKQRLALALKCTARDIEDVIRRSDQVLADGEKLEKNKTDNLEEMMQEKPYVTPEPEEAYDLTEEEKEPHCPYDDPVEEPSADPQDKPWMDEKQPPTELPGSYIKGKIVPAPLPDVPKENPEKKPYTKPEILASSTKVDSPDCRKGKPVPLPDVPKENPETAEATLIRQTVEDAIVVNASSLTGIIKTPAEDKVNHPAHYTQGAVECIDALEASMTPEEFRGYLKGCQMKYVWRYRMKGGVEDLKKARWYLDRLIGKLEEVLK